MESIEVPFRGSGGCLKHISRAVCRFEWCCYDLSFTSSINVAHSNAFHSISIGVSSRHFLSSTVAEHHKVGAGGTKYTKQSRHRRRSRQCVQYLFYRAFGDQYLMIDVNIRKTISGLGFLKLKIRMV